MKNKKPTTIESDIKELHKLITNNPNGINNDRIKELQGRVDYLYWGATNN